MRRLQTRAQFQAALSGSTVARTAHFALHRCSLDATGVSTVPATAGQPVLLFQPDCIWLGPLVPKRWAKRAVTRNAIRRQIYAVSQDAASSLPHAAHVVRLRAGFDRSQFPSATSAALKQAVRAELQQLFARAARPARAPGTAQPTPPRTEAPQAKAQSPSPVPPVGADGGRSA